MRRRDLLFGAAGALAALQRAPGAPPFSSILDADDYRHYAEAFNRDDREDVDGYIDDAHAWDWMKEQIPLFACPDREMETIYYYRWWAWRKHIEKTPVGFIITEFLKPVSHSTTYNAISCALGHHIAEGRWVAERRYLDDYVAFWLHGGLNGGLQPAFHKYSGWLAAALYDRWLVDGNTPYLTAQLDALEADYAAWERERLTPSGLYWQYDVADGMEVSASGGRHVRNIRPSINSYMYGNAKALAAIAALAGKSATQEKYAAKARRLRDLVEQKLWNPEARFFETVLASGGFAGVREEIGFTPWYFDLPQPGKGYEEAWKQLMDPKGFYAPYGPATTERRSPKFQIAGTGDDCQWDGPSWAFATTVTLRSAADVLNDYPPGPLTAQDYFKTLGIYTHSQHLRLPDGRVIPFLDEDQNPLTGQWQARTMKMREGTFYGRGNHYNHSAYADLIITGLVGLRPRPGTEVVVRPLLPEGTWDWFCLDRVRYRGRILTVVWDRDGTRFGKGKGLKILADGREIANAPSLGRLTARL
jgi:Mannosylglycerate hydrolase MGH1-like glycoside hydrolase domain/Glycosyl hydrolase family 65, C-terminal domain